MSRGAGTVGDTPCTETDMHYEIDVDITGDTATVVVRDVAEDDHWVEAGRATVTVDGDMSVGAVVAAAFDTAELRSI